MVSNSASLNDSFKQARGLTMLNLSFNNDQGWKMFSFYCVQESNQSQRAALLCTLWSKIHCYPPLRSSLLLWDVLFHITASLLKQSSDSPHTSGPTSTQQYHSKCFNWWSSSQYYNVIMGIHIEKLEWQCLLQ